jgi:hypothetical protein
MRRGELSEPFSRRRRDARHLLAQCCALAAAGVTPRLGLCARPADFPRLARDMAR